MKQKGDKRCKYCGDSIRLMKFDDGTNKQWMHVDQKVLYPTARTGTMWWSCKTVAEPEET